MLRVILFHIISIPIGFCFPQFPQQMILNRQLENTDPIGGFVNQNSQSQSHINTDSILIQRATIGATTYHLVDDSNGHPVFTRPVKDRGKFFILFNHPSFPPGSGHYILLKRFKDQINRSFQVPKRAQYGSFPNGLPPGVSVPLLFYDSYVVNFKDSIHGSVSDLNPFLYSFFRRRVGIRRHRKRKRGRKYHRRRRIGRIMKRDVNGQQSLFNCNRELMI